MNVRHAWLDTLDWITRTRQRDWEPIKLLACALAPIAVITAIVAGTPDDGRGYLNAASSSSVAPAVASASPVPPGVEAGAACPHEVQP